MKNILRSLQLVALVALLSSCHSYRSSYDYSALAKASVKLGVDIDKNDNHELYVESAKWIAVPYRAGGTTKRGVDCSGLSMAIYSNVYRRSLPHSSSEQYTLCRRVPKRRLKEGDLVFFSTDGRRKSVNHVGVYLKNGSFVHASTSFGVMVSKLSEKYYSDNWVYGGRMK
jgi:lipoprotein Spr